MFVARFSYDISPKDRDAAVRLIEEEVEAAERQGMPARLLIPLTRAHHTAALQFEVEMRRLDDLDLLRQNGFGTPGATGDWVERLASILKCPPTVEILRMASRRSGSGTTTA